MPLEPICRGNVSAASEAAVITPFIGAGPGTRHCGGDFFFPQEANFRVLQLNCCCEPSILTRNLCVTNEAGACTQRKILFLMVACVDCLAAASALPGWLLTASGLGRQKLYL